MKEIIVTESKDRLKYFSELMSFHKIPFEQVTSRYMGDTFYSISVNPCHVKGAIELWKKTLTAVEDETSIF